jgi:hypothetical protein
VQDKSEKKTQIQVESHSKLKEATAADNTADHNKLQYVPNTLLHEDLDTPPQLSHVSILSNNMCPKPKAREKTENGPHKTVWFCSTGHWSALVF